MMKYILDLDDPRVGLSQKPEILADDPFSVTDFLHRSPWSLIGLSALA